MNYISSFFVSGEGQPEKRKELTKEQQEFIDQLKSSEGVFKILDEHEIQDILCIDIPEIEFSEIVKKKNQTGQEKKVIFFNSHLSFRT